MSIEVFSEKQQKILLAISDKFYSQPGKITAPISTFAYFEDRDTQQADNLIEAGQATGLKLKYAYGVIPEGVTGDIRAQYEKSGRMLLLQGLELAWINTKRN